MADAKISQLPAATTPLAGTELVPIVQSSTTKRATVANVLAAGLPVAASTLSTTGNVTLGDASTDTVVVNGYMGVGISPSANVGVFTRPSALTTASQYGVLGGVLANSSATTLAVGVMGEARTAASAFTVADLAALYANNTTKGAGSTITNQHGLYIADQTQGTNNYGITSAVSSGSNKWNIYASGTAANYFAGNVGIGTNSLGTGVVTHIVGTTRIANSSGGTLQLEDTTVADGSLPFWVLQSDEGVFRLLSANRSGTATTGSVTRFSTSVVESVFNDTGADIDFRVESDTNTHAFFVQGSDGNVGIGTSSPLAKLNTYEVNGGGEAATLFQNFSTTTNTTVALYLSPTNGSLTTGGIRAGFIKAINVGGGVTALTFGTNSSGADPTEKMRITSAGNVFIGGTADRGTTVGTAALNIFNGTAPVGTLTNGISIYSSSGEAYVMDAAGNATLFSPHDAATNEWIFKSKHTPTGKVLKIDVERLLRFVNDHFGLDAVQEFIEE